ncbi:hypothetical protein GCK72_023044 [Caenorhabditis remanei]|uniref:Uncharacterized protein n=1 Tax=Caenorhabditis remanei TaxID=31234 RepID=A0A6A5FVJ1_CAERE|nr:hypothetical protein GCK72_023044 [Caenorhabditis remanei]KAF1746587.1 hypothetical protein GCK72_023044 [Caenorhabditis remanei]
MNILWMMFMIFCSANHGAEAVEIMLDGTVQCSLNKPFCFLGLYIENNEKPNNTQLLNIPFRCLNESSRHLGQVSLPGDFKIESNSYYDVRFQLFHNCTHNGETVLFEKCWEIPVDRTYFMDEYSQEIANNGTTKFGSWQDMIKTLGKYTYPSGKLIQWFSRPSIPIQWNQTEDKYVPTRSFKYLVIGPHLVAYEDSDAKKYNGMSNTQKLERIEAERSKLLEHLEYKKILKSIDEKIQMMRDGIQEMEMEIKKKQDELKIMKNALEKKLSQQMIMLEHVRVENQMLRKIDEQVESGNPDDNSNLKEEESKPAV